MLNTRPNTISCALGFSRRPKKSNLHNGQIESPSEGTPLTQNLLTYDGTEFMRLILRPDWTFEEVVAAAWEAYSSPMQFAGYRINAIKSWGNMVGKSVALSRFSDYVSQYGTKKRAAEAAAMSYSTLRGIERFYESLPDEFVIIRSTLGHQFVYGQRLSVEEDLHNEFKSVASRNPVRTITDTFSKYAIGFLNSEGGRIYWGVGDADARIEGVELSRKDRDLVRQRIQAAITGIQPKVDPTIFNLHFVEIDDSDAELFVVVSEIPAANTARVYFSAAGECWVRANGVTQKISGPAIQELILNKQHYAA